MSKESFTDIGFSFKYFKINAVFVGASLGAILCLFLQYIFFPALEMLMELPPSDAEIYDFLIASKWNLIFLILMGWLVGALYEEIVFHGFIYNRLARIIPVRSSSVLSFIFTGILFGTYHYQLGIGGVINAFIAGMFYHGLALYFKGNLWYSVFCHGTFNTVVMMLLYFGYL